MSNPMLIILTIVRCYSQSTLQNHNCPGRRCLSGKRKLLILQHLWRICLPQPDELVDCYNTTLAELLDRYAPLKTKTVTVRPQVPWYSDEIRVAKRERKRAERRWRSTGTTADLDSFKKHKNYVTHLLKEAKSAFLAEFIDQNADNQGKLFRVVKDLLVEKNTMLLRLYG